MLVRPPAVSVIIPVHNGAGTIAAALESVFRQTRRDFEVIVVDDGSDDREALEQAMRRWRRQVHLLRQPNGGAGAARNLGIGMARATLLAFLDADDTWLPEFLDRQLELLEARPELDMVWSDGWIAGDTPLAGRTFLQSTRATAPPRFESLARQTCTVLTSSVVIRKRVVELVGGFDPAIRRGQDFELWLRVAHAGAVMAVRTEPLVWRRVHRANLSGDPATELRRAIAVLGGLPAKLNLTRADARVLDSRIEQLACALELELAKTALRDGDTGAAQRHLTRTGAASSWKVKLTSLGLNVSPQLMRRLYVRSTASAAVSTSPSA